MPMAYSTLHRLFPLGITWEKFTKHWLPRDHWLRSQGSKMANQHKGEREFILKYCMEKFITN